MTATLRQYASQADFTAIGDFLTRLYLPDNRDGNWFQAVWEYAYTHPYFDESSLGRIGIWEEGGEVVAVALYESRLGEAFFQVHPRFAHLRAEMLDYAEANLCGTGPDGRPRLQAFVNDFDVPFQALVAARGYRLEPKGARPMSQFRIPSPFPPIPLPVGFRLQSLADENDLAKISRVLHRGFDHPGEPPAEGIAERKKMQSGPHFRRDLTIVTVAPEGDYASFCGIWYDAANRFGYVEPVCTDPSYRRRGLGRAAVLEAIRRCGELGAAVAFVGSLQLFYLSLGFRRLYTQDCWGKTL